MYSSCMLSRHQTTRTQKKHGNTLACNTSGRLQSQHVSLVSRSLRSCWPSVACLVECWHTTSTTNPYILLTITPMLTGWRWPAYQAHDKRIIGYLLHKTSIKAPVEMRYLSGSGKVAFSKHLFARHLLIAWGEIRYSLAARRNELDIEHTSESIDSVNQFRDSESSRIVLVSMWRSLPTFVSVTCCFQQHNSHTTVWVCWSLW